MRWSVVLLIVILAADVWYRAYTFAPTIVASTGLDAWPWAIGASEPLDCDEAAYAYIGHRLLAGDVMYRDLTENKPPLGYWLYATGVAVGGYDETAIRLLPIPAVLMTIALLWWLGVRLAGPLAGVLAAAMYVLLSTDPYLFGNGSNMEHFMNLFSVASLALVVHGLTARGRTRLVAAGVCLGAATLVKQVAILPLPVYLLAILFSRGPGPDRSQARGLKRRLMDAALVCLGLAAVIGLAAATLAIQGAGASAYEDILQYGRALATDTLPEPNAPSPWIRWLTGNADPTGKLPWPFGLTDYLVWWGTASWPAWLAAVPSLGYLLVGPGASAPRRLVAGWTIAAALQVILPGLYWQHYYLLPTPGVALTVAVVLVDAIAAQRRGHSHRALAGLLATAVLSVAMVATAVMEVRAYLGLPPERLTMKYKGGRQWVGLRMMGRELASRARIWDDPRLYVWGWQSPLHFYGKLDGVTRHFFVDNLLRDQAERDHPLVKHRIDEIMAALEARPPAIIFVGYPPFPRLRAFLQARYTPSNLIPTYNGMGLWIDRDHAEEFGRAGSQDMSPWPSPPRGVGRRTRGLVENGLVSRAEAAHDGVPALAQREGTRLFRHGQATGGILNEVEQRRGENLRRLARLDEQSGLFGTDRITHPPRADGHDGHARGHRLEHDVAEGFRQAGEGEEVAGRVVVGQVVPGPIAREPSE
jgi:4-amino-4-deoxy-L-arabinose transferase-like glycosyltransferase